jgi:transposase-like protein
MNKPTRPNIAKGAVYPTEFREEAVRYWLASGQTLAAVSADLGLTPDCLRSWRRQMEAASTQQTSQQQHSEGDAGTSPAATAKELTLAREIGELRRELEAMTRQRDILKKAISIFSEDKSINGGLK